jgi:hypothetical protein
MNNMTKVLVGVISLAFGIILFNYILNETNKKNRAFNVYDFNIYLSSTVLILLGLFLIYIGIAN